ncbi:hypothetical protein CUJ83_05220 [Methanocella sp. CWC-04]|uniref:Uncharacterized protein n=1 Tax=Methanooceanicella nereidis TaxID=2052831 RepID=A0AAP2RBP9_9EURY|nr:hypothetical protein [Methanocella sp. CWC-04]MCD1294398.1 hypothetical protein [Methanocella sp. CWC-04]
MKKIKLLFIAILIVATIFIIGIQPGSASTMYSVSIEDMLNGTGLGGEEMIVNVGNISRVSLTNPLIILGSGMDLEEEQLLNNIKGQHFDENRIIKDDVKEFDGNDVSSYDLIVMGGPNHNAYTRMLLDEGYLKYNVTDKKMPTIIFEVIKGPGGKNVAVIGDASGYDYHRKDLPGNGIIPEELMPAAAIVTGICLSFLFSLLGRGLFGKITEFILDVLSFSVDEKLSETGDRLAKDTIGKKKVVLFNLSLYEISIVVIAAVIFGLMFIYADREVFSLTNILLGISIVGISEVAHDLVSIRAANKLKIDTEYKFWKLGTITVLLTSWLFGSVFGAPARTAVKGENVTEKDDADIAYAGPRMNFILAILFLLLIPLKFTTWGQDIAWIGIIGFSANMVLSLYHLMPFEPHKGAKIYRSNKILWAKLFIPSLIVYLVIFIFIL